MFPFDTKTFTTVAQQVSGKSAVNPSLWACFVISLPLFLLASRSTGVLAIGFFVVALLPVASFAFSYLYLLFKNPRYLRSEDFHLRADAIGLFGDRDNPLHADADDVVEMIHNPRLAPPDQEQLP